MRVWTSLALLAGAVLGETDGVAQEMTRRRAIAEIDGHRVVYEDGGGKAPALVFVHGWSADRSHWHHQMTAFQDHRRIALDLPGHGESDKPDVRYSMDYFARAVLAVMDSAATGKAVLIGHSNGAAVVRQVYRLAPDRVLALVALDGALRDPLPDGIVAWMRAAATSPDFEATKRMMAERAPTQGLSRPDAERVRDGILAQPPHIALAGIDAMKDPAIWREDPIRVPSLFLVSGARPPSEAVVRSVAPRARYVRWADAGHMLQLERPDALEAVLRAFLSSLRQDRENRAGPRSP